MQKGVSLDDYKGTTIEKAFISSDTNLEKGKKCSAEKKAMVEALIKDGKSEDSAWAIATDKFGE